MAIDPLDSILKTLGQDRLGQGKQWQQQQQLDRLQRGWAEVVGEVVAAHAQPIALQRGVLQVATSSAVWSQNLRFESLQILRKLTDRGWSVRSLQFSPAQWHERPAEPSLTSDQQHSIWQQHPSRLPRPPRLSLHEPSLLPESAFEHWARTRRRQLQHLPLCPLCQTPTPPGELDRWSRCAFCMGQRWSSDKRANAALTESSPPPSPPSSPDPIPDIAPKQSTPNKAKIAGPTSSNPPPPPFSG